ncbi:putative P-loop ATPase fused to an acetyltransferase [Archaeoglobus sulfaticallidus PM70-1]|uniref:tRNA(Met) cytidine acetyltransferase TmcA n=1 Tax=Archaeoglobus sulfaticallidus PM70-1 TaxID=387631 RepID=N0BJ03_9EURY|nr:tRNA(Met) cytidine acetyltransferase TmcA [Archaeoglobus sulfaticallidus]AGK60135.1 putative P-loop ATPase fused to an acetyltransferase [Archaeoglobus sulfaticallidus PM70-1]
MTELKLADLHEEIKKATEKSIKNNHRFMVFLCSEDHDRLINLSKKIFEYYLKICPDCIPKGFRLLLAGRTRFIEIVNNTNLFNFVKNRKIHFKESENVLGETYSALVIDLTEGFNPNDLGIIIETIEKGGIIIVLSPPVDKWNNFISKWHKELVSEPYSIESVIPRFYRRFIAHTLEAKGTIIYDADKSKIVKRFQEGQREDEKEIVIPERRNIKKKLYKLCATQDQVNALYEFETFFDRKREKKVAVITADRGRGKTAILGILTPHLISRMQRVLKRAIRIMVVAQTPQSVQTYFRFLTIALKRHGFVDHKIKESSGMITVVTGKHLRVEYVVPRRAIAEARYADVVIVDEAASIDVNTLFEILKDTRYAIFSSTIHGYEGSGRSFSVRFLKRLEMDESVEIQKISLEEPIRYAKGDPIERWLYKTLLLDSKPAALNEEDIEAIKDGKLEFEYIDKDAFIENEDLLYDFFGIYVLAHYRNRPSDLVILFDMPNHIAFRVSVNGKTVCSLHVAIEGSIEEDVIAKMSEGYKPKGQIIPDVVLKHHWDYSFPKYKGLRVVRIATHPDVMDMGIGTFALKNLLEWAYTEGYDWVGSGFGVSSELLRFWSRTGFIPVHITPQRNEISGEYTVVVIQGLKDEIREKLWSLNSDFVKRVVEYLSDELKDLDFETAYLLLHSLHKSYDAEKPKLTETDVSRMEKYIEGISLYEYVSDIARPIVRYYYLLSDSNRVKLDELEERVLIQKCLQLKSWWEFEELLKEGRVYNLMHSAIVKIWKWFVSG